MSGHEPKIMCYWHSENPDPIYPQPLNNMPPWVDIVPVAFAQITETPPNNYSLNLSTFERYPNLKDWIQDVRKNGTKVILSIGSDLLGSMSQEGIPGFVDSVMQTVKDWQLDGLDLDYEPPEEAQSLVAVATALRIALVARDPNAILTAPIYNAWLNPPLVNQVLPALAPLLDHIMTMDYTSYPGLDTTMGYVTQYETAIGGIKEKIMIGVNCMDKVHSDFTPLDDVKTYAQNAVEGIGGVMLYTFNYDVPVRCVSINGGTPFDSGTGQPVNTWLTTIHEVYLNGS